MRAFSSVLPSSVVLSSLLALSCEAPVASEARDTDEDESSGSTATGEGGSALDPDAGDGTEGGASSSGGLPPDDDGAASVGHEGSGGNSGGGTGGPTGDRGPTGTCAEPCEVDADCCPFGALGCPADAYPNNWSCVDGGCSFGGCGSDADCDGLLGLGPGECIEVGGLPTCVTPCDGGGCGLGMQCVGVADDASTFCAAAADAPCENDDDCGGAGVCARDTGRCMCGSDDDCAAANMVCDPR